MSAAGNIYIREIEWINLKNTFLFSHLLMSSRSDEKGLKNQHRLFSTERDLSRATDFFLLNSFLKNTMFR